MIISPAFAQTAGSDGFGIATFLPFALIFVVFYFLLIRPQQKRAKEHREMIHSLRRGDKIVTSGGIMGTVSKVTEGQDHLEIEIAKDIKVQVMRSMIADRPAALQKAKSALTKNTEKPKPQTKKRSGQLKDKKKNKT